MLALYHAANARRNPKPGKMAGADEAGHD